MSEGRGGRGGGGGRIRKVEGGEQWMRSEEEFDREKKRRGEYERVERKQSRAGTVKQVH